MNKNESTVSSENKVFISSLRGKLWRNNRGVAFREDGTPIRFGLGNESTKTNKLSRSSDQIGILPVVVTQAMVGNTIGVFMACEDKKSIWKFKGSEHEICQLNYINHVNRLGGIGFFSTCLDDTKKAIIDFYARFN